LAAQPWRTEEGEIYATVLLDTDESLNGICRIPGLPECAAPNILATAATKPEEAEIMIDYAWQARWSFKGTLGMTMDLGTDHAFEFSVTYNLEEEVVRPTLETLWVMGKAIINDGIILPEFVSRNRKHHAAYCEKVNQSIQVLWRQKLPDETLPKIP
jgi:hypothetical protein